MASPRGIVPPFISNKIREARRFYLDLKPAHGRDLKVVCGGWERCAPDYRVQRSQFPYLSVEFVAGGAGRLKLGGKSHQLRRGVIFSYGPGCPHLIETDPEDSLSKYFVDFVGREALEIMKDCGLSPGACKMAAEADEVQVAFEQVLSSGKRSTKSSAQITALQVHVLLLRMADAGMPLREHNQSSQTYLRCRNYLDEHFLKVSTAGEAARECHVDPAYLSRLFARYSRQSPYRYLLQKKMMRAAELLDSGKLIVREVADNLGMDPFHFSRVFKRVHGMSPAGFIKRRGTFIEDN